MNVTIYPGRPAGVNFEAASVVKNIAGATVQYCDTEDPFISEGSIAVGASQTLTGTYFFVTPATALLSYTDLGPTTDAAIATLGTRIGDEEVARAAADTALDGRTDRLELFIVPAATGVLATDTANILATVTAAAAAKGVCEIRGEGARYVCAVDVASLSHVKIRGDATLHNPTASDDALKLTDCPEAQIEGLWVQGEGGTRDAIHLERCPRAKVRVRCQGSGRYGVYAEECIGIDIDAYVGIDVASPYPTGVTNCTGGVVLTWDGVNIDSGCNQFSLDGFYVIGKDRGWAVEIIRAEGGVIGSMIPELSKGGIKLDTCENVTALGYYGEANPSDVEYTTGTASVTSGNAAVTGSGTAWNTNDGEGNKNAMVGKFLIVGTSWAQISAIGTDTAITLANVWPGSTAAGTAYRMQSVDLYLKACKRCTVISGRGGGAVLLEGSSQNILHLLTESIFFDSTSSRNYGRVITNRASASSTRVVDNGTGNRITQINYQTGALVGGNPAFTDANNQQFTQAQQFMLGAFVDPAPGVSCAIKVTENIATDYLYGLEKADPSAPPANVGVLYFKDVGGKTALMARFPTGAVQQIAIEP